MKDMYPHRHTPLSDRRILCGARLCTGLASIMLTDAEEEEYRRGGRSFRVQHHREVRVV